MTDVQTLSAFGTWYRRSYPNSPLTDEQVAMLDVFRQGLKDLIDRLQP